MHTNLWDDTYRKLVTELGRRPTNNEVQARMLEVMFGGQNNETTHKTAVDKILG
jgi:hypothetical protein